MAMLVKTSVSVNVVASYPLMWMKSSRNDSRSSLPTYYTNAKKTSDQKPCEEGNGGLSTLQRTMSSVLIVSVLSFNIPAPPITDTYRNVPENISGAERSQRIQKPKSAKAEACTRKCVGTCIRGGGGAPGEGPLNVRKPLVVFKEGFRSRQYCLVECSDICNLIGDGDDGP